MVNYYYMWPTGLGTLGMGGGEENGVHSHIYVRNGSKQIVYCMETHNV